MVQAQPAVRQLAYVDAPTRPRTERAARLRGVSGARAALRAAARVAKVHAQEAVLLLSVPAAAPVRLIRRDYEIPENELPQTNSHNPAAHPVLLVHGFGGAKSSWSLVESVLRDQGMTVATMGYAPVGNSVEQLADKLIAQVDRLLHRTGAAKVHLVGHSLGGVIIALAVTDPRLRGRVEAVVTLGSPFGGSPWADVLPVVDMVRALRAGSPQLVRVASTPLPDGLRWLAMTASLDVVVPGLRSRPPHPQADTVTVDGVGHLGMLLNRRVIGYITAALGADESPADVEPAERALRSAS